MPAHAQKPYTDWVFTVQNYQNIFLDIRMYRRTFRLTYVGHMTIQIQLFIASRYIIICTE
jgi:hypothetical protein